MKKGEYKSADAAERALARLITIAAGKSLTRTEADMWKLLRELQRNQVELEMQTKELRGILEGTELPPIKFDRLYNLSHVGYFTFDSHGLILEANLAGAQLLGTESQLLVNKPFFDFIASAGERDNFSSHLESVLQRRGVRICETRLIRNDGTVACCKLQSIAVEAMENKVVHILASIVDDTFGKYFRGELQKAHDKLELTVNERTGELTRATQFLADLYVNPHLNLQETSSFPMPSAGFGTLIGAAIVQDGNPEESAQLPTATCWKNFRFLPIKKGKNIWIYGLLVIGAFAGVSPVLLQSKGKPYGKEQKITKINVAPSFKPQTSARKMNQEKNSFAVIKFKVSPKGAIYINDELKGVAPILRELKVKKGKYAVAIKYKHYKTYRRVVDLAPQEQILIEHSFRKNTATAPGKSVPVRNSGRRGRKSIRKVNDTAFSASFHSQ